jgi:hypothetical protein
MPVHFRWILVAIMVSNFAVVALWYVQGKPACNVHCMTLLKYIHVPVVSGFHRQTWFVNGYLVREKTAH